MSDYLNKLQTLRSRLPFSHPDDVPKNPWTGAPKDTKEAILIVLEQNGFNYPLVDQLVARWYNTHLSDSFAVDKAETLITLTESLDEITPAQVSDLLSYDYYFYLQKYELGGDDLFKQHALAAVKLSDHPHVDDIWNFVVSEHKGQDDAQQKAFRTLQSLTILLEKMSDGQRNSE